MTEHSITSISSALEKAVGDMNVAKKELEDQQAKIQIAGDAYNKSVENVQILKSQLDQVISNMLPGMSTGRIRVT